jgi:hypothetical protein
MIQLLNEVEFEYATWWAHVFRRAHAKFPEFWMHRAGDMNLSLFSFPEFCILKEQELRRIDYMKDIVLYEVIPTKFVSYFSQLYCIWYKFSKFCFSFFFEWTYATSTGEWPCVVRCRPAALCQEVVNENRRGRFLTGRGGAASVLQGTATGWLPAVGRWWPVGGRTRAVWRAPASNRTSAG